MTAPGVSRTLSQDQRRALEYVIANAGVTTRDAAVALHRSPAGLLSTLRTLETKGHVRGDWPNRPGTRSYQWYPTEEAIRA